MYVLTYKELYPAYIDMQEYTISHCWTFEEEFEDKIFKVMNIETLENRSA